MEIMNIHWNCKFCGQVNRVSLREHMHKDFPKKTELEGFKPWSCYGCGASDHFELIGIFMAERRKK